MDKWACEHDEEVIIQTGFSSYEPKHCKWSKLYAYQEMIKMVSAARLVITHGGPSSFIAPLQIGKTPIVVPRKKEYGEHVNDHQAEFCNQVAKRQGTIIVIGDIRKLGDTIKNYDDIVNGMNNAMNSNNKKFCEDLGKIVDKLIK